MLEIVARTDGGYRTDVTASFAGMAMDEPTGSGGTGTAPTPMEALLASLGGCTAITLKMYAARKDWPLVDVQVRVTLEPGSQGTPSKITQSVTLLGELDGAQRERLHQIAGRCPVHRILDGPTEIVEELVDAEVS